MTVKTLTGKTIKIYVHSDYTGYDVKLLVQHLEGVPPDQQRIFVNDREFSDDLTFADLNIIKSTSLYLVLKLRGGMYHRASGRDGGFGELKEQILFAGTIDDDSDADISLLTELLSGNHIN